MWTQECQGGSLQPGAMKRERSPNCAPRKRDYAAPIAQCISTTLSFRDGPLNATSRVPRNTILPT